MIVAARRLLAGRRRQDRRRCRTTTRRRPGCSPCARRTARPSPRAAWTTGRSRTSCSGETALPSDLDPTGAVATLFAYQPREGVAASEFSGTPLTAAGGFADPDRPAARVTEDAWSIGDFVTAFPADYDGYVQLRLYLGTPEAGTLSDQPYDTADLRVDGDRWELVRGGTASCADAESALVP